MSSETGQIYIFDVAAEKLLSTYTSHAMAVRSFASSPDSQVRSNIYVTYPISNNQPATFPPYIISQLLISASEDKRLIMHDVRHSPTGKPGSGAVATLSGHASWVLCADVSPDGRFVLSGYDDHLFPYSMTYITSLRSADKTMRVWDLSTRTSVSTIQDTGEVWSVAWRPKPAQHGSSGEFVSGGEDGVVRWWRSAGAGG